MGLPTLVNLPTLLFQNLARARQSNSILHVLWLNRILLGASAISFVLWFVPILRWAVYPFRLFVVYVHEACHCLAAILTGGGVDRFTLHPLHPNYRGLAYTHGGKRTIITSAGYIGSVLVGGTLLFLTRDDAWIVPAFIGLGIFILVFTVFYARNFAAIAFGLLLVAVVGAVIYFIRPFYAGIALKFLAVQCCFGSWYELVGAVRISRDPQAHSDASIMHELTGIPAVFWTVIWSIVSLAVLGFSLRYALRYS